LDVKAIEHDIAAVAGLDRYQTVTWRMVNGGERGFGVVVTGRVKPYAPPFMMLGINLENTTSSDFRITTTARYLAFDIVGSGSELRIDGTIGSDPGVGIELYRPIGPTPLFVAPYAGVEHTTFNFIVDDAIVARYGQTIARAGVRAGVNLGANSDVRIGAYIGRTNASIEVGDPGFPRAARKADGRRSRLAVRYPGHASRAFQLERILKCNSRASSTVLTLRSAAKHSPLTRR
jgi:NTE family protein